MSHSGPHTHVSRNELQTLTERCRQRVLELSPLLKTESAKTINEKTRAINLECRTETLEASDRLLEHLNPAAQAALTGFVESTKAGTKVSVPKKELDFYRLPK